MPRKRDTSIVVWLILGLGLVFRIWLIQSGHHIYYPDEIFQTIEQSYRLLKGFGIIPWEYQAGIRTTIVPILFFPYVFISSLISNSPEQFIHSIRLCSVVISLSTIYGIYLLAKNIFNQKTGIVTCLIWSLWYEAIYFSTHTLIEQMILVLLSFSIIGFNSKKSKIHKFSMFLLGIASYVRPQYLLIYAALLGFYKKKLKLSIRSIVYTIITTMVVCWIIDWAVTGQSIPPSINYLKLNLLTPISRVFGTQPWYYFIESLVKNTFGIIVIPALLKKDNTHKKMYQVLLFYLVCFSLISHKEYRFIIPLIPIWILLVSSWISNKSSSISTLLITVIIGLSLSRLISKPLPSESFPYFFTSVDPLLVHTLNLAQEKNLCGVFYPEESWVTTGGYVYLNKDIPLYTKDYPPPQISNVSHTVTREGINQVNNRCSKDSSYHYQRSFIKVDRELQKLYR